MSTLSIRDVYMRAGRTRPRKTNSQISKKIFSVNKVSPMCCNVWQCISLKTYAEELQKLFALLNVQKWSLTYKQKYRIFEQSPA